MSLPLAEAGRGKGKGRPAGAYYCALFVGFPAVSSDSEIALTDLRSYSPVNVPHGQAEAAASHSASPMPKSAQNSGSFGLVAISSCRIWILLHLVEMILQTIPLSIDCWLFRGYSSIYITDISLTRRPETMEQTAYYNNFVPAC